MDQDNSYKNMFINTEPAGDFEGMVDINQAEMFWAKMTETQAFVACQIKSDAERLAWWWYGAALSVPHKPQFSPTHAPPYFTFTRKPEAMLLNARAIGEKKPKAVFIYPTMNGREQYVCDWSLLKSLAAALIGAENTMSGENDVWLWQPCAEFPGHKEFILKSGEIYEGEYAFSLSPAQIILFQKMIYAKSHTLSIEQASEIMMAQNVVSLIENNELFAYQLDAEHTIPKDAIVHWSAREAFNLQETQK